LVFNIKYSHVLVVILSIICYTVLGYHFKREQFILLFFIFTLLFFSTYFLINYINNEKYLFYFGLIFRLIFLFSTPFLSQDFYRFIWDGRILCSGINPFQFQPNQIINTIAASIPQARELYTGMGNLSASHFSNYPPVNQFIFALAGLFSGKSITGAILIFKLIIILADIGIYYFGKKLLIYFNQNPHNIFWYFINPLVIVELTGNLHFEGVMLFFLVTGFFFLSLKKWILSSIFIAISISVKLLPLLLLPLFWQFLGLKKSFIFYFIVITINILFFIPFFDNYLINNYMKTISLWFINFEFNASFYYLIREVGFYIKGYNIIETIGKIIPLTTILIVLIFAFYKKNNSPEEIVTNALFFLSIYFFISTTVHPWYCINLIILSVFTRYRFAIVWSFVIVISYYAYSIPNFKENMYLIIFEYLIVFGVLLYELKGKSLNLDSKWKIQVK
jgi:alpha-1,6-mannosyltransferase